MRQRREVAAADFNFASSLSPGDQVVCGQVCAEPLTLTHQLLVDAEHLGFPINVFVGTLFSDTFDRAPGNVKFLSYGAIGRTSAIADRGLLDVVPEAYSKLPSLFAGGQIGADVVLLQAAEDSSGFLSCGLSSDYVLDAARVARVVIVEVNSDAPWTYGTPWPEDLRVDCWVRSSTPPLQLAQAKEDPISSAIAQHVASIIPDGATLQVGVGSLPDAALKALMSHRHLGLHSGVLGDFGVALLQCGVIDNSLKGIDLGVSVANTLCGSQSSYAFADHNKAIEIRHSDFTHVGAILAKLSRFHAINGALEVDLSGQANCEILQGKQRGGIGGLLDFSRAARASAGGRSITVLPSTASAGKTSRIVSRLTGRPATLGRADVDVVVTEYGIADLRGASLHERARRLIAVSAPAHREQLMRDHREQSGVSE